MAERSSVFDMIGPVMIGPSSSHTAAVVRIGRVARQVLGCQPQKATITFYNSFARTYEGHGSDRAIIAGLLDYKTDDVRIKNAFEHAGAEGMQYTFRSIGNASTHHPNTVKLHLMGQHRQVEVIGESRGGGLINIAEIDGFAADFSANLFTLILKANDAKGSIAFIANVVAQDDCNIATMSVSRRGKNKDACHVIEVDSSMRPLTIEYINSLSWVHEVIYIPEIDL